MTTATKIETTDTHYIINGEQYTRVSEILRRAGLVNSQFYTEDAADKGTGVHETIEMHLNGTLDEANVHPEVMPYFTAFKAFMRHSGVRVNACEALVYSDLLKVAGTADLFVMFPDTEECIIDIKTGQPEDWHRLQLQAYICLDHHGDGWPVQTGRCLYLSKDGSYKLSPVLANAFNTSEFQELAKKYGG